MLRKNPTRGRPKAGTVVKCDGCGAKVVVGRAWAERVNRQWRQACSPDCLSDS